VLPSWQTTVVLEFGGTTTVVFAGGGGLELLMQPDNSAPLITRADKIFIVASTCFELQIEFWAISRTQRDEWMARGPMGQVL
jgi:hypothetical protein